MARGRSEDAARSSWAWLWKADVERPADNASISSGWADMFAGQPPSIPADPALIEPRIVSTDERFERNYVNPRPSSITRRALSVLEPGVLWSLLLIESKRSDAKARAKRRDLATSLDERMKRAASEWSAVAGAVEEVISQYWSAWAGSAFTMGHGGIFVEKPMDSVRALEAVATHARRNSELADEQRKKNWPGHVLETRTDDIRTKVSILVQVLQTADPTWGARRHR